MLGPVVLTLLLGMVSSYSTFLEVDLTGSLPIILSAPHGGTLKPENIPDRQNGCYDAGSDTCTFTHDCTGPRSEKNCKVTTVQDYKTDEVARTVFETINEELGAYPKMVISKLHRTKLDPNREKNQATMNEAMAEVVYDDYHSALTAAREAIPGNGLLIDIHGHNRPEEWQMLGYLISGSKLNKLDPELEDLVNTSSIRSLASRVTSFPELLRGKSSFGAMLSAEGYMTVPSPDNPRPNNASFYSGGYITKIHGSKEGGNVDAIQVEIHRINRTPKVKRDAFSKALGKVIVKYYETYYKGTYYKELSESNASPMIFQSRLFITLAFIYAIAYLI